MNSKVVLIAQKFCADHFCNNDLDMENYMVIIDDYLNIFDDLKDRVEFLIEVKRIGTLFVADAQKQLEEREVFDLAKAGFSII
jgi:hypothetical protein